MSIKIHCGKKYSGKMNWFVYLPSHQRTVVTWCRLTWGPRYKAYQTEQPESSSVHSLSETTRHERFMSITHLHYTAAGLAPADEELRYLDLLIDFFEHRWDDKRSLHSLNLLPCGPDIPEENLFAFRVHSYKGDRGGMQIKSSSWEKKSIHKTVQPGNLKLWCLQVWSLRCWHSLYMRSPSLELRGQRVPSLKSGCTASISKHCLFV